MQRHCLNYGQYCYELYTVISIDVVVNRQRNAWQSVKKTSIIIAIECCLKIVLISNTMDMFTMHIHYNDVYLNSQNYSREVKVIDIFIRY